MAYNKGCRFSPPPKSYKIFEPGAYQNEPSVKIKPNKVPFLSKTPRVTQAGNRVWTDAIYSAELPRNIPNITAFISKRPRFPYEALSAEDIEDILCRCGLQNVCECPNENEPEPQVICQGKVRRRIYKGHPPRSVIAEGLAAPSKRDHGFEVQSDGKQKRSFINEKDQSPPFYNTRVNESTAFYQGCKWSQWTSSRATKALEQRPGPADYSIEKKPTQAEICTERLRSHKRKTSKQLRFIEMVQKRNILEGRPGPATYSPKLPVGTNLEYLGPKARRFHQSSAQHPGPADYWIPRDFDPPSPPEFPCHATLPEPSFFGVKAVRFKPRRDEGPGPVSYSPSIKGCNIMHCTTIGFGSSTARFKDPPQEEDDSILVIAEDEPQKDEQSAINKPCPTPTWGFKSKTIRLKPLIMKPNEQSPADFSLATINVERPKQFQFLAPFNTSEGRLVPWNNWMSVLGRIKTPGPGYYSIEKPKCIPAVCRGPLTRACRFPVNTSQNPGPGEYKVGGGIETILTTHNKKLMDNMENQHKFHWEPPVEPRKLTLEEREILLLNKSIALLEVNGTPIPRLSKLSPVAKDTTNQQKLLRYFLYSHPTKQCF